MGKISTRGNTNNIGQYWTVFCNAGQYQEVLNKIGKYLNIPQIIITSQKERAEATPWTILDNIWQYCTILDNIWQYCIILDNIWQNLKISDNI